jgi:hypothetical protein
MPVILATWEAEIERIVVQGQFGKIVLETPHLRNKSKMDWRCGSYGRVSALQAQSPVFKPSSTKKKTSKQNPTHSCWPMQLWLVLQYSSTVCLLTSRHFKALLVPYEVTEFWTTFFCLQKPQFHMVQTYIVQFLLLQTVLVKLLVHVSVCICVCLEPVLDIPPQATQYTQLDQEAGMACTPTKA